MAKTATIQTNQIQEMASTMSSLADKARQALLTANNDLDFIISRKGGGSCKKKKR